MPKQLTRCLELLALFLLLSGSLPVLAADHATVFIYHRFGDPRYPSTNTSITEFRAHLETLKAGHYAVLPLAEIVERLRSGAELPDKCVAITVDDAFRSFLSGAMPLLREFGYPVTLFVNAGEVGGEDFLDWRQLRGLMDEGVEIGNHSSTHGYLLDFQKGETLSVWRERVRDDIRRAQAALTSGTGKAPRLFAYPYGEFDNELLEVVRGLGFLGAVGQQSGVMGRGQNLYSLPRFPAGGGYGSLQAFRDRLRFLPLPLTIVAPGDTRIEGSTAPLWRVAVDASLIDPKSLRCYVPGQSPAEVRSVAGSPGTFEVRATRPLDGRRSKYTLTGSDRQGRWYWYSQLWVSPRR